MLIPWKHDELQADLARHLRGSTDRMVWCDTQLGPSGSPRPDIFAIAKSYSQFKADAYEIKISVSDLRSDTTSGKWQKYLKFAHRVWFAIPAGLVRLDEIPRQCGVIVRHENVWRAARKPISQALDTLPRDAWIKLLIEAFPNAPMHDAHRPRPRPSDEWTLHELARKKFGGEIGQLLDARRAARSRYEDATRQIDHEAERQRERLKRLEEHGAEKARLLERSLTRAEADLAKRFGLPENATPSQLVTALDKLDAALQSHSLKRAIKDLQHLQEVLDSVSAAQKHPPILEDQPS